VNFDYSVTSILQIINHFTLIVKNYQLWKCRWIYPTLFIYENCFKIFSIRYHKIRYYKDLLCCWNASL